MKFGRYLAVMASSWVLAAAAVVGFNLLVDAIGHLARSCRDRGIQRMEAAPGAAMIGS